MCTQVLIPIFFLQPGKASQTATRQLIWLIYARVRWRQTRGVQIRAGGRNRNRQSLVKNSEAQSPTQHCTRPTAELVHRDSTTPKTNSDLLLRPQQSQTWREVSSKRVWYSIWARRCSLKRQWRWPSTSCITSLSLSSPHYSEETSYRSNLTTGNYRRSTR